MLQISYFQAFSKDGGIVLEANLPYSEYTMGQRGKVSFLDAKIVNIAYCSRMCILFSLLLKFIEFINGCMVYKVTNLHCKAILGRDNLG